MRQYWCVFLTSPIHGLGTRLQSKMYNELCNGWGGNGNGDMKETET